MLEIQNMKPCSKSSWATLSCARVSVGKTLGVAVGPGVADATAVGGSVVATVGPSLAGWAVALGCAETVVLPPEGVTVTSTIFGLGVFVTTTTTVGGIPLQPA